MISSLTTSTTTHQTDLVAASSALSIERQEKTKRKRKKRDRKKQRHRERKFKSMVSRPAELSTCSPKRLFVFILIVNEVVLKCKQALFTTVSKQIVPSYIDSFYKLI